MPGSTTTVFDTTESVILPRVDGRRSNDSHSGETKNILMSPAGPETKNGENHQQFTRPDLVSIRSKNRLSVSCYAINQENSLYKLRQFTFPRIDDHVINIYRHNVTHVTTKETCPCA
jgi:hypothetical protein